MTQPIDLTPPKGFVISVHPGAPAGIADATLRMVDHRGVAVYNWFTLRIRRRERPNLSELRAELVYRVLGNESVALVAVFVDPTQLEVDASLAELKGMRPFDWWKRYALQQIAVQIVSATFDPNGPYALPGDDQAKEILEAHTHTATLPLARRVNRITDSHLDEVARVYTEAWKANSLPTDAVRLHFGCSYSTAARWVGLARKASPPKLGPPTGPHGGTWGDDSTASK